MLGGCGREKEDWVTTSRVYVPLKALFLVKIAVVSTVAVSVQLDN